MNIELKGFGVRNKGGELMYLAVVQALKEAGIDAAIAVEPRGDFRARMHYPLLTKFWIKRAGVQLGGLGALLPGSLRSRFGVVLDREIDVVLDASGFAYGDTWGYQKAHDRLGSYIRSWRKQGKPVILLPQAFGPFTDGRLADEMKVILEHADLVYARDEQSLGYLQELGDFPSVRSAPDFTNLLHAETPESFDAEAHRFCVIPNAKMLEKSNAADSEAYLASVARGLKLLQEQQRRPYLLIHESEADLPVARELEKRAGVSIPIVERTSPLDIKGIIKSAEAVLTSRFHGAVSGLCQGVPTLATSWSHKYRMLMRNYDVEENLVGLEQGALEERLEAFADPKYLQDLRQLQGERGETQRELAAAMWREVAEVLRSSST